MYDCKDVFLEGFFFLHPPLVLFYRPPPPFTVMRQLRSFSYIELKFHLDSVIFQILKCIALFVFVISSHG